jgi:hypothetical protein
LSSASAEDRERWAIEFLERLPEGFRGILVGGYAVLAYGPPRFSVDVDLVLATNLKPKLEAWLKEEGLSYRTTFSADYPPERISKLRVEGDRVSGDLYFGGLRSRGSGAFVDYDWISLRPRSIPLNLTSGSVRSPVPVARPEALWVLKLLAGRSQDITDLFAISGEKVSGSEVLEKFGSLNDAATRQELERVIRRIRSGADYVDALSRRGLGSPKLPRNVRSWQAFVAKATKLVPPSGSHVMG